MAASSMDPPTSVTRVNMSHRYVRLFPLELLYP
jgi:hypothetical protein